MKIDVLGQEVEVTKDNIWEIQEQLNKALNQTYQLGRNLAVCSRCDSTFEANDPDSQWTEDGVLCSDCHSLYTIKHYDDGGVGVIDNKTGKPLHYSEIRWL